MFMEVPSVLYIHEPDRFEFQVCTGTADSGVVLLVSDSSVSEDAQQLAACGLALSANQVIGILDGLRTIEEDMRREIAAGRGGRVLAEWIRTP